ncbi:hypothetical protein FOA52_012479 [Chlamydomonas sp. UWO 241]|nr:hypothetical protein FOA52_012479 [Chlamydomonas sp. UWO 241]
MQVSIRANRAQFAGVRAAACPSVSRTVVVRAQADRKMEVAKQVATVAVANLIAAAPSFAEAGKIFDFNATLPVMAGEFLLLMVILEKTWFTPVGAVLDKRDADIREKLSAVKDNTGDVEKFASEAAAILKAARAETSSMVNSKKQAKQAELDAMYYGAKDAVTKETDAAIAVLEKESQGMLAKLDAQVESISGQVLSRVLPTTVKI